ncbi:unnamed protein product [Heligmosomoides polygyrus]|uniref:Thioredoxin domain-containing protein n=1 Tax=Heligmosomoides polygyrus TaxID=6339 RepID=A0A3P8AUB0_HELPZ|nr:unnamed protein product [Heligmosomoides polygyrus]
MRALVVSLILICNCRASNVEEINSENIDNLLKGHQMVFAAFGADWCPYSRELRPIFEESATEFRRSNPMADVIWARVDCEAQQTICQDHYITKYPTMKMYIFGDPVKHEYRGTRSVAAITKHVQDNYRGSYKVFNDENQLRQQMNKKARNIVAYTLPGDPAFQNAINIALLLRAYCTFWVASEALVRAASKQRVIYKPPDGEPDTEFLGDLRQYNPLKFWIMDKCIPVVREVTFENVEGLTEEGLPFLIFFRDPEKKEDEKMFTEAVIRELHDQRLAINPLLADGKLFSHPLRRLGKTLEVGYSF